MIEIAKPKTWRAGVADEPWKVAICERDIEFARETLSRLCYILTDSGSENDIAKMTGAEIVNAIKAYARRSAESMNAQIPSDSACGLKSEFLRKVLAPAAP